ncbi:S4 domain-containing protein YaaA [Gemella sp. GH3]|uniref:S4 domain-containing protein YaaA n=1 Tax=unclassified Gemella TaxID=2624949 RepID=UPI0015D0C07D|nr:MULTISPECIES: S4 domain-containing protein YaaA [unclassified Gemella]MBF0714315.1 S4 domain-containing protein YaaA [Gemella sp. GH3.1]NYS51267.1 S4 domain-containing protein YaaA [Gemella sp. GH3]
MKKIFIDSEFITLTQFLKIEGFIGSGGEAKHFLMDNGVVLNGELENRRGKKLYNNDIVQLFDKKYLIVNET